MFEREQFLDDHCLIVKKVQRSGEVHYKSRKAKAAIAKVNSAWLKANTPHTTDTVTTTQIVCSPISGCIIFNMDQLWDSISSLIAHSTQCGGGCTLDRETMHLRLAVILQASCVKCGQVFSIRTSRWRELSTGGRLTHLNFMLVLIEVPGMHKCMYSDTKDFLC